MNNQLPPPDHLEQWATLQLQSLPSRRAPQAFTERVMAELQRRAALPWWRKSFLYWPFSARLALLACCLGLANVSVSLLRWLNTERRVDLSDLLSRPISWSGRLIETAQGFQAFLELVMRHLPAAWLYSGLLAVLLLYVALFGIGAAAYRTLYANR